MARTIAATAGDASGAVGYEMVELGFNYRLTDLQAALDAHPQARAFFEALNGQNRYAILFRIQSVKKAETRARKIAQFVDMLANGGKLHP